MTLAEALAKLNAMDGGALNSATVFQSELKTVRDEAGTHRVKA